MQTNAGEKRKKVWVWFSLYRSLLVLTPARLRFEKTPDMPTDSSSQPSSRNPVKKCRLHLFFEDNNKIREPGPKVRIFFLYGFCHCRASYTTVTVAVLLVIVVLYHVSQALSMRGVN